jgi:diaminopimelate decarboxylase
MSVWTERISPEEIASVVRRALAAGHLGPEAPAFIAHDLGRLSARLEHLKARFPPDTLHAVAIKANPLVEVLRALVDGGAGLEAASRGEVALALAAGCPPERIVYDSPAKSEADLEAALRLGIHVNADNEEELRRIASLRERIPSTGTLGIRVNPMVGEGRIALTSVSGRASRFGIPCDPDALHALLNSYPWLTALHIHVGSQGCALELLVSAVRKLHELMKSLNHRLGREQLRVLDIGGGLPATYSDAAPAPEVEDYVVALRAEVPGLFDGPVRLVTEFGRSLQVGCGWAVSRVEYVKTLPESRVAVVHLGADFMLRTAYHPKDWVHEFAVLDRDGRPKEGARSPWTVAGPLCFAGDVIGRDVPLPEVEPGDLLVIRDSGGYTLSMWSRYCSREMPAVLGYSADSLRVLREREAPEDLVAFWRAGPRRGPG